MKPKISIIVSVYNVEKYLTKCIDSILAQIFTDFELILINDGSSDNCGDILDEYAKKDNRIRVIHKKNEGCSAARNDGIKVAKGEYIGFVDSDDYINQNMYREMYELMKNNDKFDVIQCGILRIDSVNNSNYESIFKKPNYVSSVWSKLLKKSLITQYKIEFPLKSCMGEDLAFTEKYMSVSKEMWY
ncbi:glycosyltransferase [Cetobacterium sp.]|uniref:glycosyltransferase n=1 Tax=Cetobacterium sp. TaxID=2071632 RepID=UPI003F2B1C9F